MAPAYVFRPLCAADLPTVRRWLTAPHFRPWWGDPDEQFAFVSGDLDEPAMEQFIVITNDRPFAYLQCYDAAASSDNGFGARPRGTPGIDLFIGEPDMTNCGLGSALLRAFVADLRQRGTPLVLTDPAAANLRAIQAYEKAGFRKNRAVNTPDGAALLMVRNT
ncbi:MAG TPA: GNAT family N-acetyltransferase [Xanthobacteraceae bacterium]